MRGRFTPRLRRARAKAPRPDPKGLAGALACWTPSAWPAAAHANGALVFLTQQSLRARGHPGALVAFLLLSGLLIAVIVLSVAQLLAAARPRVDPAQGAAVTKRLFCDRNPTRSPP